LYVGAKTGRDGIHGATMASEAFDETTAERRATVQVGDPFTEKLLLEACLEAFRTGAVVCLQDIGAADLALPPLADTGPARDAGAGGAGRGRGPRPRAPARARNASLRDPALGVPGADAARRRARARDRGPARLPEVGAGRGADRACHGRRRAARPDAGRGGG